MPGQVRYLEAEAAGVRGTSIGVGCYFDDAVHGLLGIQSQVLQGMHHFTTGDAMTDKRLQTLPAYAHLKFALGSETSAITPGQAIALPQPPQIKATAAYLRAHAGNSQSAESRPDSSRETGK